MSSDLNEYIEENVIDYFGINEKIDIIRSFAGDSTFYPSYIKDVYDDKIVIDYLFKGGVPVPLYKGKEIDVFLYKEYGILRGASNVLEVEHDGHTGVIIKVPEWLEHTQRRGFLRWQAHFPVTLYNLKGNEVLEKIEFISYDISGSGIAVITKNPTFKEWEHIIAEFKFENLTIKTVLKFIQAHYIYAEQTYKVGFKFLSVDAQLSNEIHKAITKEQLECRRKGII